MNEALGPEAKLLTAAGFAAERPVVEPLMAEGRNLAYSKSDVTLQLSGDKSVKTITNVRDGVQQPLETINMTDATLILPGVSHPMGKTYSATVLSPNEQTLNADLKLEMHLFSGEQDFHVTTSGLESKVIDGSCKTEGKAPNQVTTCVETVSDGQGNKLGTGKSTSDVMNNVKDFHRTSDLYDASGAFLAEISQHVQMLDDSTMRVQSVVDPKAKPTLSLDGK